MNSSLQSRPKDSSVDMATMSSAEKLNGAQGLEDGAQGTAGAPYGSTSHVAEPVVKEGSRSDAASAEEKRIDATLITGQTGNKLAGAVAGHAFTQTELHLEPQDYKRLLRKIDFAIVPYVTLLYLLSFLDRVNIGQANTLGLRTDLGLIGNQYAVALTVFFVSYVAVELPSMIWFKKIGVRYCIPAIMVLWAIVMTLMGVVQNAAGLQAARFFLGLCEGPLFPLLNYMLSCWYTRKQQGTRVAIFFSGATLSGAFGGILAYGLSRIHMPAGPFEGENWRWIFIIEGILTLLCALPGYWLLVDFPAVEKRLLSPLESAQWNHVLAKSQGVTNAEVPFSWAQVKAGLIEWRTWVHAIMYLAIANPLYSLALFTPQIITGLGSFPKTSANLLSVPPYVVGFITTITMAWFSDRFLVRSVPIIAGMLLTIVGYIILICNVTAGVKYFALHLTVAGVSPCIALAITWTGNTFGPAYKRATCMAIFFSFGNSAGLISSNVYPLSEAPRYFKGHGINLGFSVLAIVCAVVLGLANMRENKQRDKISYAHPDGSSADPLKANDEDEKARWGLTGMSRQDIVLLGDKHPGQSRASKTRSSSTCARSSADRAGPPH